MIKMYIGLNVKYRLLLSDLLKLKFSQQIVERSSHINFLQNPSSGSGIPCGRNDRHDEAIVAFGSYGNALKIWWKGGEVEIVSLHTVKTCKEVEV